MNNENLLKSFFDKKNDSVLNSEGRSTLYSKDKVNDKGESYIDPSKLDIYKNRDVAFKSNEEVKRFDKFKESTVRKAFNNEDFKRMMLRGRSVELGLEGTPPTESFMPFDGVELAVARGNVQQLMVVGDVLVDKETLSVRTAEMGTYSIVGGREGLITVCGSDGRLYVGLNNSENIEKLKSLGYKVSESGINCPLGPGVNFARREDREAWDRVVSSSY